MHLARKVRPRWVWAGTLTMVLAMIGIGVANIAGSTTWQLVGVALLIGGGGSALSGGVMRDVHGVAAEAEFELDDTEQGVRRAGVTPGELVHDPQVVAEVDTRPRPSLLLSRTEVGSFALAGLILVAVWLVVSRSILGVPFEPQTSSASLRDVMVAVVVVLLAVLLRQHGPSRLASGLCAASGLLLVVASLTATYAVQREMVSELVSGAAIVVLAVATLLRPHAAPG